MTSIHWHKNTNLQKKVLEFNNNRRHGLQILVGGKIMRTTIYLFLLFICLSACNRQNAQETIDSSEAHQKNLQNICDSLGIPIDSSDIYYEILLLNKQLIPYLIDCIDINKTSFMGFKNPIDSYIGNYHFNQYGIRYAYLIDYVLSKDSIEIVNKNWEEQEDWIHWDELTKPYRIYRIGVIVKQDENNKPILEPLTHEDMVKIKKMYSDWWKQNKDKSIETLRKEFRKENKILKLPYVWI